MSNNNINNAITNFTNALSALAIAIIGDATQAVSEATDASAPGALVAPPQGYVQVTDRGDTLHFQMAGLSGDPYVKWDENPPEDDAVASLVEAIQNGGDRVVDSLAQTSTKYLVLPVFNGQVTFPNAEAFTLPAKAIALLS